MDVMFTLSFQCQNRRYYTVDVYKITGQHSTTQYSYTMFLVQMFLYSINVNIVNKPQNNWHQYLDCSLLQYKHLDGKKVKMDSLAYNIDIHFDEL